MTTASTFESAEPRSQSTRDRLPALRAVLIEHVRAIGYALRVPMLLAAAFAVLATVVLAIQIASGDMDVNLLTEPSALPGGIGALLAIAIWAREERFGPGFLWTLPVDRMRHALIKVLAGWLWLMAGVVLYALCLLVLGLVAGDGILPVETLHILTTALPRSAPVDPADLRIVQWAPGPLIWAVPFGAATAPYLLASAFMLGARRPLRWVVAAVLFVPVASFTSHVLGRQLGLHWLAAAPERARVLLSDGPYGIDTLLKLRTWSLDRTAHLASGDRIEVWSGVPDLGGWGIAALLWIGAGLLALWAAAFRHREQRRA